MLNIIWLSFIMSGVLVASFSGHPEAVTNAALGAAENSVELVIKMSGAMALWMGLMKIAEESGIVTKIAGIIRPLAKIIFPSIPPDHPAMGSIVMNMSANMLGLGNAATPFGLKAMQELQELNKKKDTASDAMCTFLALNTASITLIPATVIVLRSSAGSSNPTEIVGPTIFATVCATTTAICVDRLLRAITRQKR